MTQKNPFYQGWNKPHTDFSVRILADITVDTAEIEKTASAYTQMGQHALLSRVMLEELVSYLDLTTLDGGDTGGKVTALCARALAPLGASYKTRTAAVCVYPHWLTTAKEALHGALPVAVVAGGFPHGQSPLASRIHEVAWCAESGADEIDIVIPRTYALEEAWESLFHDIAALKKAAGKALVKTILSVGDIQNPILIARTAYVAMLAGSDFIKTSTGKEQMNANLPHSLIMLRMIKRFHAQTGIRVGFKPAGGLSTAQSALTYRLMMEKELGEAWLHPHYFRIGASSLLNDLQREHENALI